MVLGLKGKTAIFGAAGRGRRHAGYITDQNLPIDAGAFSGTL